MDYDVIIIGAGHNALVAGCYLARAGYRVGVFERRHIVGGAVSTEEIIPGYKIDYGGSAHILIRLTPIVEELELESYGLEYLELDPMLVAPSPNCEPLFFYRSVEQTADELERKLPGDGVAYRRFIEDWKPFAEMVKEVFLTTPGPFQIGKKMLLGDGPRVSWKDALRTISRPYGEVVDDYFTSERLKAALVWMAAQSGPPPTDLMTAPFLLWHPLYHVSGVARPRGGSGMLSVALRDYLVAHGGEIHVDAPVSRIETRGSRVRGVHVGGSIYTARAVLSGAHAVETFTHLLPPEHRPPGADTLRVGNGFGVVIRAALDEPVAYAGADDRARVGLQLLCRDRQQIMSAYGDFLARRPATDPPIIAMTFSAVDATLAPPGGEVLWLWAQYFPYELAEGTWDDRGASVAESIFAAFEAYAPGTRLKVVDYLFEHPLYLERELGLFRGNVMHLDMSLDQMFCLRPTRRTSGYRAHLDGLYLTGASTHPGGGIMGASGRNAATVLLRDLEKKKV